MRAHFLRLTCFSLLDELASPVVGACVDVSGAREEAGGGTGCHSRRGYHKGHQVLLFPKAVLPEHLNILARASVLPTVKATLMSRVSLTATLVGRR